MTTSIEEQRPDALRHSVEGKNSGCVSSRLVDNRELPPHVEAVGDNGLGAAGSHELGECRQQARKEDEQVSQNRIG